MAMNHSYSPAAGAYAQALIELARDLVQAEELGQNLSAVAQMVKSDDLIRLFFADPSITPEDRAEVIQKTLSAQSSELFVNFVGLLNRKNRLTLLGEIATAYREMLDRKQNIIRVQAMVAQKLDDADLASVQQRVSAALGKTAIVEQIIDDGIIGGLVLQVGDKIIDGSVKAQLEAMRKQLLAAKK